MAGAFIVIMRISPRNRAAVSAPVRLSLFSRSSVSAVETPSLLRGGAGRASLDISIA
jgi:hypothetical protein